MIAFLFLAFAAPWTVTWQSGVAETMQLSLGGTFHDGPAQTNRITAALGGLQVYAWDTTDLRTGRSDQDMGLRYRRRVGHGLIAGGGLEHWRFPSVLGGTRDVVVDSYVGWSGGERFPVTISANGKTLVRSDLHKGTFACFQAMHTVKAKPWLAFQHGPAYVYSWDLYGRKGHRVLRYYGVGQVSRGAWTFEAMFRPQLGLQPGIPDNKFWTVGIARQFRLGGSR